jgi:hypothetical protein
MLWNAKIKPEGFCAVRPTEFFGKFAPYWPIRSKPVRTRITETNCIVLSVRGALTRFVEPVALPIRLPRALAHGTEIMFGVLVGILRLDLIAG